MPASITSSLTYSEDFNTLASSGTGGGTAAEGGTRLPNGWIFLETGTNANLLYTAGTGSSNTGDTYSFGTSGSTDRALGGLLSGSLTPLFGVGFSNDTGATITSLTISYYGEQWRLGTADGIADRLDFQYSLDASGITSGTWINVDGLDFASLINTGTVGLLNGNLAANRSLITATISGLNIAPGQTIYFRWADLNVTGSDDGLAVDDFSLVATTSGTPGESQTVTISGPPSVSEGDSGAALLTYTVTRSGGTSGDVAFTANFSAGTTNAADFGGTLPGPFSGTIAAGQTSATFTVSVTGDTTIELTESFSIALATVGNSVGTVTTQIGAAGGSATTAIVNDDIITLAIGAIQGEGHLSPFAGQQVRTSGIVTAVAGNGFYLQDGGDGNARTSDGVFVFTGTLPTVQVGHAVNVMGLVTEFKPSSTSLTITQLNAPAITVTSTGNPLPTALRIGADGVLPPSQAIEDDGLTSYDPANDGIDFWESLEGMRVTIATPQAVSNTNGFGETDVVASFGVGATGMNDRGGITIGAGDFNPEKIQIDELSTSAPGTIPVLSIGDRLADVTGVVNYAFNFYEVLVSTPVTVTSDVTLSEETTALVGDATHLTIATYNLENLDPGDGKYVLLASDIVLNLRAPDILAVQEIQDADGAGNGANLSGQVTAQGLIDAIVALGGPRYVYIEIAPSAPNTTGGEPNGNIRNGYFYNPDRVDYLEGSAALISSPAYAGSRSPLTAQFSFNGETFAAINVHFTSRGGSQPLWGDEQPPANGGEAARLAQAGAVLAWVNDQLATNPNLEFAVLGDFNGFYFENFQQLLTTGVFTNLNSLLPSEERYSYLFEGNAQQLDHILVSGGLLDGAAYDAVHLNSQFVASITRPTDHDPQLASLYFNAAPTALALDDTTVDENLPAGTTVGTLSGTDTAGDALAYALLDDAGERFSVDAATGAISTNAAFDFEGINEFTIVASVTDQGGKSFTQQFVITVGNVNEAPSAVANAVSVDEDATTGNLWSTLLGNDSDPDAGDSLTISAVDTTGTLGSVVFDAATQTLRFVADADIYDTLAPGETQQTSFTYTARDAGGLTSTATVTVTVTGIADGIALDGGNGADHLIGTSGEDTLSGDRGDDVLEGGDGHDVLKGGQGADWLYGGSGNDLLIGGQGDDLLYGSSGKDVFVFGKSGGADIVFDFDTAHDRIALLDGLTVRSTTVADVDGDGIQDLVIGFRQGGSVTLLGVNDPAAVQFGSGLGVFGADLSVIEPVQPTYLQPIAPLL